MTKRRAIIITHAIVWILFYLAVAGGAKEWVTTNQIDHTFNQVVLYALAYILNLAVATYVNYFILVPGLFLKRKFGWYSIFLILLYLLTSFIKVKIDILFLPTYPAWAYTVGHFLSILPFLIIFTLATNWSRLLESWIQKIKREQELEKAKLTAELKWLKAQVNPHFLFNVLNNIHTLVYFKSDQASPAIVKLSEMMRYLLHDCTLPQIYLSKEIDSLKNYIQLQCFNETRKRNVHVNMELNTQDFMIEPLLLINFVENAFKHSNVDDKDGWINVTLSTTADKIMLHLENTYKAAMYKDSSTGIGLKNVSERLAILYPDSHSIDIKDENGVYAVTLVIEIHNVNNANTVTR